MGCNENIDYGYASASSSSSSLWLSREKWASFPSQDLMDMKTKPATDMNVLMRRRSSVDDVMREFRMNGLDSPYNPDEDNIWALRAGETILGTSHGGAGGRYSRQHSWPFEATTSAPRPTPASAPTAHWLRGEFATSTPIFDEPQRTPPPVEGLTTLTEQQSRALGSLPDDVLETLLKDLRARTQLDKKNKNQECRFCKNNGERESYYRSHNLKTGGRVSCPVLRAFVCRRCGATGDEAHTLKYCPLATAAERLKSMAMMRSVRMASGRKRYTLPPSAVDAEDYLLFGDTTPAVVRDNDVYKRFAATPLNPLWAALEKKLML